MYAIVLVVVLVVVVLVVFVVVLAVLVVVIFNSLLNIYTARMRHSLPAVSVFQ